MNEFELINRYFMHSPANGDDAALIPNNTDQKIVTSIDTLVIDRHFRADANPSDIGYKSLAVSLSDIAAMGAQPTSFLLSLSLPTLDPDWIRAFSDGLYQCASEFNVEHLGGDITRGPLTISTVAFGSIHPQQLLRRSGAQVGDDIYVSGFIGDAAAALHDPQHPQQRLNRPQPRVALGMALGNLASSCIDISDGLAQDLQHILNASQVGATITIDTIPHNSTLEVALTGGDDYELCFTAAAHHKSKIQQLSSQLDLALTCIGTITAEKGLRLINHHGKNISIPTAGYQHF